MSDVVGFVFQNGPPKKHHGLKLVLASFVGSIWGSSARIEATTGILGPRLGPSLAILDHVKVSGSYNSVSWAKLLLSQAMFGHVEAICPIFCGPCGWFCIQKCSPPAGPRSYVRFCGLCWLHLKVKYENFTARWCHLGANFGAFGLCWRLYGIMLDHIASA